MILLLVAIIAQMFVWAVVQLILYIMILKGIHLDFILPLYIIWFWTMFYMQSRLNVLLAIRSMRNRDWDKDGTLDPFIRNVRMYIRNALIRRLNHG